jgi:hypothetical protein
MKKPLLRIQGLTRSEQRLFDRLSISLLQQALKIYKMEARLRVEQERYMKDFQKIIQVFAKYGLPVPSPIGIETTKRLYT